MVCSVKIQLSQRKPFGWAKIERLRKHPQFCRVQNKGKRIGGKFILMIFTPSSFLCPRSGITVSKKVGNSVVRNKLKRRFRDILRQNKTSLPPCDIVWIARPNAHEASYEELKSDFLALMERAQRQILAKKPS